MIKLKFVSTHPEDIEMQLTITMKISEWMELAKQLDREYPAWRLSAAIRKMVEQSNAHYEEQVEVESEHGRENLSLRE